MLYLIKLYALFFKGNRQFNAPNERIESIVKVDFYFFPSGYCQCTFKMLKQSFRIHFINAIGGICWLVNINNPIMLTVGT